MRLILCRDLGGLLVIIENLLKNPTNFSNAHVRICAKGAMPLLMYKSCIKNLRKDKVPNLAHLLGNKFSVCD